MSSRELIVLLEGLPAESKFKVAAERTFRVVEGREGEHKGQLFLTPAIGPVGKDVDLVGEFVDWTLDRKLLARNVRELIAMRSGNEGGDVDFAGLTEPLQALLQQHFQEKDNVMVGQMSDHIRAGLYGDDERS